MTPRLLWASERKLSVESAQSMSITLDSDENSAWLILGGSAMVDDGNGPVTAGPGEWLIPPPKLRQQSFQGPLHFISVTFSAKWDSGQHLFPMNKTMLLEAGDCPRLEIEARRVVDAVASRVTMKSWYLGAHEVSFRDWLAFQEVLLGWMDCFAQVMEEQGVSTTIPDAADARFLEAQRILNDHNLDEKISVDDLAAAVGLSRRQLERLYQMEINCSPRVVFEKRRIQFARWALSRPDARIKEVAAELGFADISNFRRWFTRIQGVAPKAFAKWVR
ncbi:helix-turn-helix transcriptional regulator [Verrucomicrobiaceae bacterium N1E253]|uniref:Helix-turn-helix transcriptional regulator n=1 Tax=Oceaniferula marina TaxID=2748318 RepID=A0A851GM82_9BACT|nr:AraC family transcriptional regulator [Oceaniferula marina]NWK56255.1 helix-turn-helix transcriptional regulator [Oceaniferula marina]